MKTTKAPTTDEAALLGDLYDSRTGFFEVQQAHAALFLLKCLDDEAHLGLDLENREDAELAGWCRAILMGTIEEALGTIEQKIADAAKSPASATPGPVEATSRGWAGATCRVGRSTPRLSSRRKPGSGRPHGEGA